jgi:aspartate aminotransferase-like enzyme
MAQPMIHHRSGEFQEILMGVRQKLKNLCGTSGQTMVLSCSGSGAMEASVASLFKEGDEVLVVVAGKFGQRWQKLAQVYGLKLTVVEVPWGQAVDLEQIQPHLHANLKGLMLQACETSTGVFHPVAEIGALLQAYPDCLFLVDAITALGIHDLNMDRDGIDGMVGGSQKALMCPPGLATLALSDKAMARIQPARGLYFSLAHEYKAQSQNSTAFTPAISLFQGLHAALEMIEQEGKENVFQRHQFLQQRTRHAFQQMQLPLLNRDQDAAHGLTAVGLLSWDVGAWLSKLKKEEGLWLAGGQDQLKGKVFRFAHMGYCDKTSVDHALALIHQYLPHRDSLPSWQEIYSELT